MLKQTLNDLEENGHKGDWCFLNDDTQIALRFGEEIFTGMCILPIATHEMEGKPHWQWNGNREKPTLTPSIMVHASFYQPEWHGFLTDGELITV